MAQIKIDFLADISNALGGLNKFTKQAESSAAKINNSFSILSKTLAGIGAGLLAGFSLKQVIDEAAAFEDSVNKVRIALKLSGIESEEVVSQFVDYAGALQQTTRFGDDAILSAGALIQSLGQLTQNGLERSTKAALDLSTALGIDLQSAATLVGKAAAGEVSTFSRYGLIIKKGATETETLSNALTAIEAKFGGSSEQAVKSYAGAIDQLKNNFSDAIKEIGLGIIQNTEFLSAINALSAAIIKIVPQAVSLGTSLGEGFSRAYSISKPILENLPAVIGSITTALVLMNAQLIVTTGAAIIGGITKLAGVISTLGPLLALVSAPAVAAGAAIAGISVGVGLLIKRFTDARKESRELNEAIKEGSALSGDLSNQFKKSLRVKINSELKLNTSVDLTPVREEFKKFTDEIVKSTASDLDKVKIDRDRQIAALDKFRAQGVVSLKNYESLRLSIVDSALEKELAIIEKSNSEKEKVLKAQSEQEIQSRKRIFDSIGSAIGSIGQGANGVAGAFANFGALMVDTIIPGLGGAAGQLISFLAQGPDAVRSQIQGFVDNIPVIIQAIVESIPEVVDVLAERAPLIIQRLVEMIPEIAAKTIAAFAFEIPYAAVKFAVELIGRIPGMALAFANAFVDQVGRIVTAIADGVKNAVKEVGGGIGKVGGGILGGITGGVKKVGKVFGFAEGGIVPGGAPFVDRVPAMLTPGEAVFTRDDIKELKQEIAASSKSAAPSVLQISLQLGEKQMAEFILNLTRQGYRLQ